MSEKSDINRTGKKDRPVKRNPEEDLPFGADFFGDPNRTLRTVVQSSPLAIIVLDTRHKVRLWNPAAEALFGWQEEEVLGRTLTTVSAGDTEQAEFKKLMDDAQKGISTVIKRTRRRRKDGVILDISISAAPLQNDEGQIIGTLGIIADITDHKQVEEVLRESEERYRTILENIEDCYYEADLKGNLLFFNDVCKEMSGYGKDELIGMNYRTLSDNGENLRKIFEIFNQVYATGKAARAVEWDITRKDGSVVHVEASVSLTRNAAGEPAGFRGIVRDVTSRKKMQEAIAHLAYHDNLTGLPNRLLFNDRLAMAVAQSSRKRLKFALLMLDLDRFKDINDTYGHAVGDRMLRSAGMRLSSSLRKADTVARMGGDEFLVLLQDITAAESSFNIARKILNAFERPFVIDGREFHISTSIGIAVYPDDGLDAETLLKHADAALYRAKKEGRNRYLRYLPLVNGDLL